MRTFKRFGVLAVVVCALGAIGAANASAAEFTASETGELTGKATSPQVLTTNGGTVECTNAAVSGTISSTASAEQEATINYSGCKAFGFANVHITPANFKWTITGTVHLLNKVTITVTGFLVHCTVTITPQSLSLLRFTNNIGRLLLLFQLIGILTHSSGGVCGAGGENATFEGTVEVERVGGGTISYDP